MLTCADFCKPLLIVAELLLLLYFQLTSVPLALRIIHYYYLSGASIKKDVVYGSPNNEGKNALDVHYIPHGSMQPLRPVVVFVYGGIWSEGDKVQYALIGMAQSILCAACRAPP